MALSAAMVLAASCHRPARVADVAWRRAEPGLDTADLSAAGLRVWAVRFDPDRFRLRLVWSAAGLAVPSGLAPGFVAAINGSYFEPDLRPSGLLIDEGREVHAAAGGSGALVLDDGRLAIVRLRGLHPAPRASVLQTWPLLIEPGGADGIRGEDGKRSRRSAIGLTAGGYGLLVSVPDDGISLFSLMQLCRRLGAVVAANLDGGPSAGFALAAPPGWSAPSATPVSNALVLLPRFQADTAGDR